MQHMTPIYDRLSSKFIVDEVTSCWVWIGAVASSGYGKIGAGGKWGKTLSAHRVAWEKANGQILNGLQVLHRCDNKLCINPQHLFLGTQKDNIQDCMSKGRAIRKLDNRKVLDIRERYKSGQRTVDIAKQYRIHTSTINKIVARTVWGHI